MDAVKTAVNCQPVSVRTGREGEVDNRVAGVESNEYALLKTEVAVANGKIASRILEKNTVKNPNFIADKKQAVMDSKTNQNLHGLEVSSHKKAGTQTKKVNKPKLGKFAMIDASNIGFGELEEEDDTSMNGTRQAIAKIGLEDLEKQFVSKAKVESSNPKRSQIANRIRGEVSGPTNDENPMAVGKRGKSTRFKTQNVSKQKDRDGDSQIQAQTKISNPRNTVSASQQLSQQNGTFHGNRTYKNNNKQNRMNHQQERNGHKNGSSRGKHSHNVGNRSNPRNIQNQISNNLGYLAHSQFIAHQTYSQQPYQQIQYDPAAIQQQLAMYHQQNMMPQIQVPQANGNIARDSNNSERPSNSNGFRAGSNVSKSNNRNRSVGATRNSANSIPRSGIAPPPGMVNSPNFDGQVKTISNDNGKSVAEEEQAFPSGTIITNNGTYAQQGQPQYAPPGMAGYAPGPAYPQGGYYPQQFYGIQVRIIKCSISKPARWIRTARHGTI